MWLISTNPMHCLPATFENNQMRGDKRPGSADPAGSPNRPPIASASRKLCLCPDMRLRAHMTDTQYPFAACIDEDWLFTVLKKRITASVST